MRKGDRKSDRTKWLLFSFSFFVFFLLYIFHLH